MVNPSNQTLYSVDTSADNPVVINATAQCGSYDKPGITSTVIAGKVLLTPIATPGRTPDLPLRECCANAQAVCNSAKWTATVLPTALTAQLNLSGNNVTINGAGTTLSLSGGDTTFDVVGTGMSTYQLMVQAGSAAKGSLSDTDHGICFMFQENSLNIGPIGAGQTPSAGNGTTTSSLIQPDAFTVTFAASADGNPKIAPGVSIASASIPFTFQLTTVPHSAFTGDVTSPTTIKTSTKGTLRAKTTGQNSGASAAFNGNITVTGLASGNGTQTTPTIDATVVFTPGGTNDLTVTLNAVPVNWVVNDTRYTPGATVTGTIDMSGSTVVSKRKFSTCDTTTTGLILDMASFAIYQGQ